MDHAASLRPSAALEADALSLALSPRVGPLLPTGMESVADEGMRGQHVLGMSTIGVGSIPHRPTVGPSQLGGAGPSGLSALGGSGRDSPLGALSMPELSGHKGGYLYARVLEAGNLDCLQQRGGCCSRPVSGALDTGLASMSFCCCACGCVPRAQPELRVTISGPTLERPHTTSLPVSASAKTHAATFGEDGHELLARSLNFCGVEKLNVSLQTKSGAVAEATVPLRAAMPSPLSNGVSLAGSLTAPPERAASVGLLPGRGGMAGLGIGGGRRDSELAAAEASCHVVEPRSWLPRQRIQLRPVGGGPAPPPGREPYLVLQLLQLVDGSLPRLRDTHPLMVAIEQRQELLVRAYLAMEVVETLSTQEQSDCVMRAIEHCCPGVLVQLLDQIRPTHQHLLAAVRLRGVDLVEALLQAGGPALLHPHRRGSSPGSRGRRRGSPSRGEMAYHQLLTGGLGGMHLGAALGATAEATPGPLGGLARARPARQAVSPPPVGRLLTPLSVACSVGDVAVVEAMCQWARRERVHLDPTAPSSLGPDPAPATGTNTAEGGQAAAAAVAAANAASPWWDADEMRREGDPPAFGDPPMVMAVRSRTPLANKLKIITSLAGHGFTVDVRSPVDSWTPLLAAVDLGSLDLVTSLVELGARLSADRNLGFTPLHLACQMGHWQLVPFLVEAMQGQYSRVAAWGPSPQYVSVNLVDAYGRTALDIALLRYFANANPLLASMGENPTTGKPVSAGNERQKAVDILREFIHRSPPPDGGVVCGWELLRVLRFLDTLPTRKTVGAQLLGGDWDSRLPSATDISGPPSADDEKTQGKEPPQPGPYGDIEEMLQAIRVLVRGGAQTKWLLEDLVAPPPRGAGCSAAEKHAQSGDDSGHAANAAIAGGRPERSSAKAKYSYSPIDPEDMADMDNEECAALA